MADDGTIYAADKKTVIGSATILNRFRPGSKEGTWLDSKGNLYGRNRKTIIKTAEQIREERVKAEQAAEQKAKKAAAAKNKAAVKAAWAAIRQEERERSIANKEAQRIMNERILNEAFGKKDSND